MIIMPDWFWFSLNILMWFGVFLFVRWINGRSTGERVAVLTPTNAQPQKPQKPVATGRQKVVEADGRRFQLVEAMFGQVVKTAVREFYQDGTYGPQAAYVGGINRVASRMVSDSDFPLPSESDRKQRSDNT